MLGRGLRFGRLQSETRRRTILNFVDRPGHAGTARPCNESAASRALSEALAQNRLFLARRALLGGFFHGTFDDMEDDILLTNM